MQEVEASGSGPRSDLGGSREGVSAWTVAMETATAVRRALCTGSHR